MSRALVAMLADDPLGAHREDQSEPDPYLRAFAAVDADPAHLLLVAEASGEVVGTLHLNPRTLGDRQWRKGRDRRRAR